jgi:hypothetical protein
MTWIPIEQQLPDDDIEVLVFGPDLEDHCWIGYMDCDVWRADNGSRIEVTHWMHLPSSPGKDDSSSRVAEVVVVTDSNSGDEAVYIDGKLTESQSTFYLAELVDTIDRHVEKNRSIRIRHQCVEIYAQDETWEFPEKLDDLTASFSS